MADPVSWTALDGGPGRMPHAAVGPHALSPDDALLAWCEGPSYRAVRVTDTSTLRTVVTLDGDDVVTLRWATPDVLWVLRRRGEELAVTAHAVPDGGVLGEVALPRRPGLGLDLSLSADGAVGLLAGARHFATAQRPSEFVAYRLRGPAPEALEALPVARVEAAPREGYRRTPAEVSPDGRQFVVVDGATTAFVDLASGDRRVLRGRAAVLPAAVRWVAPGRVLVAYVTDAARGELRACHVQGDDGADEPVAAFDRLWECEATARVDLHPGRTHALVTADESPKPAGVPARLQRAVVAVALTSDARRGAAARAVPVSRPVDARALSTELPPGGGACWTRSGDVVLLTRPGGDVARLVRQPLDGASSRTLLHLPLLGAYANGAAIAASPARTLAVVTWLALDRGPGDRPVRRLALLPLDP